MARVAETADTANGRKDKQSASELGRKLRRISEKIVSSGERLFTRRELERELAERRGRIR
jgi:hypothetical protein